VPDAARGWPVVLADGPVEVRPLRWWDAGTWSELRRRNAAWLRPWEATSPSGGAAGYPTSAVTYLGMVARMRREARNGRGYPFAVVHEGRLVGQLNIANVVRGSLQAATLGYWIDRQSAGHGVMPTAVALVTDHCFFVLGLHRIEVNIRPENTASRRVVEKLGFAEEGMRRRFLHIDGEWRDHICYVMLREDLRASVLAQWKSVQRRLS
jgi:ribosomal-protein-alanine N-acetyltransferase